MANTYACYTGRLTRFFFTPILSRHLPPVTKNGNTTHHTDDNNRPLYHDNEVQKHVETVIADVSDRSMEMMLREMRKLDRDRDRVLHPMQVENLLAKYKVLSF